MNLLNMYIKVLHQIENVFNHYFLHYFFLFLSLSPLQVPAIAYRSVYLLFPIGLWDLFFFLFLFFRVDYFY